MSHSLNGAHILITRPQHQADALCQLIDQQGGVPVRFPTLAIVGMDAEILSATNSDLLLSKAHWLIFTSANAVNFALAAIGGKIRQFAKTEIAAIGGATAKTLISAGIRVDLLPGSGFNSEALLAMAPLQNVNGKNIVIVRGQGGREQLAEALKARGAQVDYWEVYKRIIPQYDASFIHGLLADERLAAVVATSGESLENLLWMLGPDFKHQLNAIPLVVISARIAQVAAAMGFTRVAVTINPSDQAILDATIAIINEDQRG